MGFKPKMISKTSRIILEGSIEEVFPLFGPIREKEWASGWEPNVIYPDDCEVEEHMVFRTKSHTTEENHYLWIVSQYSPENHFIEYTVSTPERVFFISIRCLRENETKTSASITYAYIGFSDLGNHLNEVALDHMFSMDLKDWEEAINHYLKTGKRLQHHQCRQNPRQDDTYPNP